MNSSELRLTTDGAFKQDPVFTKADEIVFTLLESAVQTRIVRLKLGEAAVTRLHPLATTSEFEASFTADAGAYAFVQSRGNLNMRLVIRTVATGQDTAYEPGGGFSGLRRPSFHPKGDRVCFAIPTASGQEIAYTERDGKGRKTLATGGINNWPAYSPDGKRIAFSSSRDGGLALYVMSADGSGVTRVGKLDGMQMRPCWSPDGSRLAFTWNHDGVYNIYAINLDGSGLVRLTASGERSDYATWHPNGQSVVLVGERRGKFDLYRVDV